MNAFWILWIFNAVMSLVPLYFFIVGLGDGSINNDNMGMWLIIMLVIAAILGGSYWLKESDHLTAAKVILGIATIPSVIAIIFFLTVLLSKERWN